MHPKRGKAVVGEAIVAGLTIWASAAFPVHADPDQHCTEDCGYHGGAETNNNPNYGESGQGSGQARQNAKSYLRSRGLNLSDAEADKALDSACGVGQMPAGLTAGQYATIFYGANKYLCP